MSKLDNLKNNNYILGKKGYIVSKKNIEENELEQIRNDLSVIPFSNMDFGVEEKPFRVYRENSTHLYLPKFYGLNNIDNNIKNILPNGKDIDINFSLELKEEQKEPARKTMEAYQEKGGGILSLPCGFGKCIGRNTPIMMFNGTIKMVQDINVGDVIMGDDSTPRNVLSLARGREQMYKVIPKKGDPYIVNESHILSLKYSTSINKNTPKGTVVDMSVTDYLNLPKHYHGRAGPLLGYRVPIEFPKKEVHIDPYFLGFWLGDGSSNGQTITTQEASILNYLNKECFKHKHKTIYLQYTGYKYDYRVNSITQGKNELKDLLRDYNLINNKHIPQDYKCNDRQTQLELLAGLIDSDGSMMKNGYDIIQKNELLLDDIIFLARSLGFAAYKTECKKYCYYKGEKREGTYFRTYIHGKGMEEIPVKCIRKKCTPRKQIKDVLNTRIRLEKLDVDDYYGFEIDNNRRFVLGDFTVTHNTILGLYFVSKLKKKTMVIVHKEFLMNQWIERIKFALPEAKIGIVQGNKCEIEGVDIVLAMLQTLSMRKFPKDTFDDFGHVIIDECHRIPSRTFSKALFKINCKYMLGLSATPNRKDGLTKVLKWFIGELIYSVKMNEKNIVKVNRYLIKSDDKNYNKEILSFRGQVQMATMINNMVNYIKRSQFIVNLIEKELEDEKRQILILSDRRQQLEDFERLLKEKDITSVGYYVGGVKKKKLKENESCRVLLGTFPMANEGLDIPTLNGLILATPKSDIIQSVGRISRVVHKDIQPLIIDIVDQFSMFERQGGKRFQVYKKKKYEIEDFEYNMDSDNILGQKRYFFHNVLKDEEYESSDDECEKKQIKLDEESEDEDKFLNMDTDNYKVKKKEKKSKKENINNLLNSMSLFS